MPFVGRDVCYQARERVLAFSGRAEKERPERPRRGREEKRLDRLADCVHGWKEEQTLLLLSRPMDVSLDQRDYPPLLVQKKEGSEISAP